VSPANERAPRARRAADHSRKMVFCAVSRKKRSRLRQAAMSNVGIDNVNVLLSQGIGSGTRRSSGEPHRRGVLIT
jgi:hypothetical protein